MRIVWLASSGTEVAAWNRVRLVNARRGLGLLDFEGSGLPISVATWPASAEKGGWGWGAWCLHETKSRCATCKRPGLDINIKNS